jgi:hypothetical protein
MSIWYILLPFGLFYVHLIYFIAIWSIVCPFDIFYCRLVHFVVIWYIFPPFGMLHHRKSGNPGIGCKFLGENVVGPNEFEKWKVNTEIFKHPWNAHKQKKILSRKERKIDFWIKILRQKNSSLFSVRNSEWKVTFGSPFNPSFFDPIYHHVECQ